MKHVLRLLTIAGAVAGAVWYARQRQEAEPLPAGDWSARPNLTAVPDPHPAPSTAADDLTVIRGIGPKYAAQLAEAGITSLAALAAADPASLAEHFEPRADVEGWIAQARERTTG